MSQLVIIGNGFDRTCGLNSNVDHFLKSHFFEDESNTLNQLKSEFVKRKYLNREGLFKKLSFKGSIKHKNFNDQLLKFESAQSKELGEKFNFWELLLYFYKRDNEEWNNIESIIKEILDDYFLETFPKKYKDANYTPSKNNYPFLKKGSDTIFKEDIPDLCLCLLEFIYSNDIKNVIENNSFTFFLQNELAKFESNFSNYLNNQVKNNLGYAQKFESLLEAVLKQTSIEPTIISFNYTQVQTLNSLFNIHQYVNVHGNIQNGKIIFGIDSSGISWTKNSSQNFDDRYLFTKTYRRLLNDSINEIYSLPVTVDNISFYGHSLSQADYSYFQSIFDHYSIYNSKVKIQFFYREYGDKTDNEIRLEQVSSVIKLLSIYSQTLENSFHGKNLIHKLLLENRLSISKLELNEELFSL